MLPSKEKVETQVNSSVTPAARDVLEVRGLSVEFDIEEGWTTLVEDVSFSIGAGQTVGLVGESGSGKTVTSMAIMGLLSKRRSRVSAGQILLDGTDLLSLTERELANIRGSRISMIFQEPMTSLNPAFTVGAQIAETIRRHRGLSRKEAWRGAVESLSNVGIPAAETRARAYPHEFSGGMRQRVMIAMALCCEPSLLIADEPTTALDVTIQAQVLDLIRHLRDSVGMSMLFVTHDLGVVADICDRVVVLYAGQVVETSDVVNTFHDPRHPYTDALLRAMPLAADGAERSTLFSIPGQPPMAGQFPGGCRFAPRCEFATPECTADEVPLHSVADGRASRCIKTDVIELRGGRNHHG